MAGNFLTYGEAHTKVKMSLRMENGRFVADAKKPHIEKMNRKEAIEYYNAKFASYFGVEPRKDVKEYKEPTVRDFDSVESYYDYFEALRIKERLIA